MSGSPGDRKPVDVLRRVTETVKGLPLTKWAALARAAPWVLTTRLALGVVPWKRLSSALGAGRLRGGAPDLERARDTIWAVHAISRRVLPDRPCLTQALVARRLLRDCGVDSTLRMGAVRRPDGDISAHAWLEHEGRVILGWSGVEYAPFETRRGRPSPSERLGDNGGPPAGPPTPSGERSVVPGNRKAAEP